MHVPPYLKAEAIELSRSMPAWAVRERLGLAVNDRTIQRWARREYGTIPTRRQLAARNPEREALVRSMEADGLHRRYCVRGHTSFWPCLIRGFKGEHVFVCRRHAERGDF